MQIVRSGPHPESARHELQVRAYEGEGSRVILVEWERPRRGGHILKEEESCLLSAAQAKTLYLKARHAALEDVPELLRKARPRTPLNHASSGRTVKVSGIALTPAGADALSWLEQWMGANTNTPERPSRSAAVDLAVQDAARARGWKPPEDKT
jgi:hypothetical protein